jgi:hypothetical protein
MASRLLTVVAIALLVAACGGTPRPSTIDDPRVLLQKVTERIFTLRTVHLKINLPEAGSLLGGPAGQAEGDFDIAAGELSVKGRSTEAAASPAEVIIDAGVLFQRTDGPWTNEPVAGLVAALPPKEAVRAALMGVAGDPRVDVHVDPLATCPSGDCYPMTIEVPGAAGWDIVAGALRQLGGLPAVPPPGLPNSSIKLYADVDTLDIIQIEVVIDDPGGRVRLVVDASNHDAPIRIDPPRD